MREIKFRGKAKYGEWVYGYYYSYIREDNGQREYCILQDKPNLANDFKINYVIPETVGQYTGLKDKNGKEIYEGDIVKYFDNKEHIVVVENIKELGTGMYLKRVGSGYYTLNPSVIRDYEVEVIGDIHNNPELLEVV